MKTKSGSKVGYSEESNVCGRRTAMPYIAIVIW